MTVSEHRTSPSATTIANASTMHQRWVSTSALQ
jgi:hypothetical protein